MEKPEPAEGSSSPSAKLRVVSTRRSGTGGERLKLTLSDGSTLLLPVDALIGAELRPDGPEGALSPQTVERLRHRARIYALRLRALRILASGAQTRQTLRRKLLARGAEPSDVEEVLERLLEERRLDDRAFAREWLSRRLERKPEGRGPLLAGLLRRGVAREPAEEALEELLSPEAERRSLLALVRKLRGRSGMNPDRLLKTLVARGFRRAAVRQALAEPLD